MGEVEVKAGAELEADAAEQLQNMADRDNVARDEGEKSRLCWTSPFTSGTRCTALRTCLSTDVSCS